MSHKTRLQEAIRQALTHSDTEQEVADINSFIALYNILGETELYDGILTAMEDENIEDAYYSIICYYEEQD